MVGQAALRDEALSIIRSWSVRAKLHDAFDVFVFGSLINNDASAFDVATSDVDFVLALKEQGDFLQRFRRVAMLAKTTDELELPLLKLFKRADAGSTIASFVVVEPRERENALHKGHDGALLSMSRFIKLPRTGAISKTLVSVSKYNTDPDFESLNKERVDAMRATQGKRNEFLRRALNDTVKLKDFDAPEPLPKDLMRRAAMVRWAEGGHIASEREDLDAGLEFLHDAIKTMGGASAEMVAIRQALTARRKGRQQARAITPSEQLILWEMLFDLAVRGLKPSTAAILAEIADDTQSTR